MGASHSRKMGHCSPSSTHSTQRRQPLRRSVFHVDSSSRGAIESVLRKEFGPSIEELGDGTKQYNWYIAEFPTENVVLASRPLTTAERVAIVNNNYLINSWENVLLYLVQQFRYSTVLGHSLLWICVPIFGMEIFGWFFLIYIYLLLMLYFWDIYGLLNTISELLGVIGCM